LNMVKLTNGNQKLILNPGDWVIYSLDEPTKDWAHSMDFLLLHRPEQIKEIREVEHKGFLKQYEYLKVNILFEGIPARQNDVNNGYYFRGDEFKKISKKKAKEIRMMMEL